MWDCLRTVDCSTSSTTEAYLWRMGGGLSVILLTVNLSWRKGINDFFHPSLLHPVYSLVFSPFLHCSIAFYIVSCQPIFHTTPFPSYSSFYISFPTHFTFFSPHPLFPPSFNSPYILLLLSLPSSLPCITSYSLSYLPFSDTILLLLWSPPAMNDCFSYWSQSWILPPSHPRPGYFQPKQTIIFSSLSCFLGD